MKTDLISKCIIVKLMIKTALFFIVISFSLVAKGQVELYVDLKLVKNVGDIQSDSVQLLTSRFLNGFWRTGYYFAGLDSLIENGGIYQIYLHKGKKIQVQIDSIRSEVETGTFNEIRRTASISNTLNNFINAGYPFTELKWDSLYYDKKNQLHGVLAVSAGPHIVNDTLHLLSSIKTNENFIQRTLELRVGDPFSEYNFQSIAKRIKRIPYLRLRGIPDVGFSGNEAEVFLDLEERPASSFEGVIGFLPNQANNDKLLITGYVDLQLDNLFSSGRSLAFTWQQFAYQSQQLDIEYKHPYLFNSKILIDAGFNLTKQDTTFINREFELGIGTFLWGDVIFEGKYTRFSGDLLTSDIQALEGQSFADYRTDLYSVGFSNAGINEDFDFGSVWAYQLQFTAGKKNIFFNPTLPVTYFDSIDLVTTIFKFRMQSKWQKGLFGKTTFFHHLNVGGIENSEILKNELFRQGGLKTLRGFNEYFFFAQHFMVNRFELRQYFEERSYFMMFYDHMYYRLFGKNDTPMGLGLGFSLATSNGLFNFALAIGRSNQQPFEFTNSKVHLGYISRF